MSSKNLSTIAAIVTAVGEAAVSVVKISGPESWSIAQKLGAKKLKAGEICLNWIINPKTNEKIDKTIILAFKDPKSYTGEDLIEIQSHGGIWITEKILQLVLENGAKLAKAGEFSERAFLNGKMDLCQAEAVLDLINARTSLSGQNAVNIYQGKLGNKISSIRKELLDLLGALTACIDFPDEVEDYDADKFSSIVKNTIAQIDELLDSEEQGHILRHGFKIAIIGKPNAGKSSLLNRLLEKERAIVTEIAGTTRDTIEESFSIKGLPVVLIDTAGIRDSSDPVEQIGIKKSKAAFQEADLILALYDLCETEESNTELSEQRNVIKVGTKLDLETKLDTRAEASNFDLMISSLNGENIEELKDLIYTKVIQESHPESSIKINHRQADLLRKAKDSLEHSLDSLHLAHDFWTIDLRAAIAALGEITGEQLTEELLDNIFSNFCIGK